MFRARSSFWRRGVLVIPTGQLHSTKPELKFCLGSNPAPGVSGLILEKQVDVNS